MNLKEIKSRVKMRVQDDNAIIDASIVDGVNSALQAICMIRDFDELTQLTTSPTTRQGTSIYNLVDDFNLIRPKDIISIRLIDGSSSRKLTFVPSRQLDELVPYTEVFTQGRPLYYTRRGSNIELFRIPDASYSLYIHYTQWHPLLSNDEDQVVIEKMDQPILDLTTAYVFSTIGGSPPFDIIKLAQSMISVSKNDNVSRPDDFYVARKFDPCRLSRSIGEYWLDPFVRR